MPGQEEAGKALLITYRRPQTPECFCYYEVTSAPWSTLHQLALSLSLSALFALHAVVALAGASWNPHTTLKMTSTPLSAVYVSGKHCIVYGFPSQEALKEWETRILLLKDSMSSLLSSSKSERWSLARKAEALEEWMASFSRFHDSFPECMVPPDVLFASKKTSQFLQSVGKTPATTSSSPRHKNCQVVARCAAH